MLSGFNLLTSVDLPVDSLPSCLGKKKVGELEGREKRGEQEVRRHFADAIKDEMPKNSKGLKKLEKVTPLVLLEVSQPC